MWRTAQGDAVGDVFKVGVAQGNTKGQAAPILRVFVPQLPSRSYRSATAERPAASTSRWRASSVRCAHFRATCELSALMHRASCGPAEARKVLREWRWGVATIAGVLAVVAVARLRRSS